MLVLFAAPASAAIDLDCADFASQADAQAVLDANPTDPNGLDEDDDGQACEDFAYATSGQVTTPPAGGVATGDGSTARYRPRASCRSSSAGLGLAAAGGAAVAARRNARGSA